MYKGKTFIISGPSGVGKSTVLKELFKDRDDLYFSVSATTRAPRPGEVDGVHYHFTDVDHFQRLISEDAFLEYAEYVGNFYGTPKKFVDEAMEQGKVQKRLVRAKVELQTANTYDYFVINDTVERAVRELNAIMLAEHCKPADRMAILSE